MTDSQREASWAALHRPNTSRQEIEAIVARYPEFAEAGTAHPNGGPIDPTVAAAAREVTSSGVTPVEQPQVSQFPPTPQLGAAGPTPTVDTPARPAAPTPEPELTQSSETSATPAFEPETPETSARPPRKRGNRVILIAAATLAILALTGGAFTAGWIVANQSGANGADASKPEIVEVPILDPLAQDALMPDVRGLDETTALQVLADAGIPVAEVTVITQPAAGQSGLVIEQTPAFGTSAPDAVSLTVSEEAAVPDVIGASAADASAALQILGAAVVEETTYDPDAAVGTVLAVSPEVGSAVPESVTLTVNVAPASLYLANVRAEESSCATSKSFLMGGDPFTFGLRCSPGWSSASTSSWLTAGAVDRITGTIGIPDDEPVNSVATVQIVADGKLLKEYSLAWGDTQEVALSTDGALKLEILVSVPEDADSVDIGLGDLILIGDPTAMSKLRSE